MMLALSFTTPLLLIGLLAAAIPPLLHLLSVARAKQAAFPTLRFLRLSMAKTARRRRIQHWLLMVVRSALLAVLAVGLAEPISRAAGWGGAAERSAVVVLDNSMSMSALSGGVSRLASAKSQAAALLDGVGRPELAAVIVTNGQAAPEGLTTRLDLLRAGIGAVSPSPGRAPMRHCLEAALAALAGQTQGRKAVYMFSDLQQANLADLLSLPAPSGAEAVDLLVVGSEAGIDDVAVSDLEIAGQPIVGAALTFTAAVVNSSAHDRIVRVLFEADQPAGPPVSRQIRVSLGPAGTSAARAQVRFQHRFDQPGQHTGRVYIEGSDDLPANDARYFSLAVADRLETLVVAGGSAGQGGDAGGAAMVELALNPFEDPSAAWPIRVRRVSGGAFNASDLAGASAGFFCDVAAFDEGSAQAVRQFVRSGGTVVFFLGPDIEVGSYNRLLGHSAGQEPALLPCRLAPATGQIGPEAPAQTVSFLDTEHAYFAGLYATAAEYPAVLVQRYFPLTVEQPAARVLMRLANGEPLLVTTPYGAGAVVICATSASPQWSDFSLTGMFLPAVSRMSLLSFSTGPGEQMHQAGQAVTIRPLQRGRLGGARSLPPGAVLNVTMPEGDGESVATVPLADSEEGPIATFGETARAGIYRWAVFAGSAGGDLPSGAFAVNVDGAECDLVAVSPQALADALARAGWRHVYVGATLEQVRSAATGEAAGRNWWDVLVAAVVLLLVVEAAAANRTRQLVGRVAAAVGAGG